MRETDASSRRKGDARAATCPWTKILSDLSADVRRDVRRDVLGPHIHGLSPEGVAKIRFMILSDKITPLFLQVFNILSWRFKIAITSPILLVDQIARMLLLGLTRPCLSSDGFGRCIQFGRTLANFNFR